MKNINVFNKIISTLTKNSKYIIENCSENKLSKKLFIMDFIKIMIYYFLKGISSLRTLSIRLKNNNLGLKELPFETIRDGFNRFNYETFKDLFYQLLFDIRFINLPELELLGRLYIADSSLFNINVKADWSCYRTGVNKFKLHMVWDLNNMIFRNIKISKGKSSDLKELQSLIEKGITYISDRAYVSFDLFKCFTEKKSYFVIRGKNNLIYNVVKEKKYVLDSGTLVRDKIVTFINDKSGEEYRLVSFKSNGKIFNLITNRFDLYTKEIVLLYLLRWQIELFFNFIKNKIGGKHLLSHSINGLYIQFYLIAITQLLLVSFKHSCYLRNNDVKLFDIPIDISIEGFQKIFKKHMKIYYNISIYLLSYIRDVLSMNYTKKISLEVACMR